MKVLQQQLSFGNNLSSISSFMNAFLSIGAKENPNLCQLISDTRIQLNEFIYKKILNHSGKNL